MGRILKLNELWVFFCRGDRGSGYTILLVSWDLLLKYLRWVYSLGFRGRRVLFLGFFSFWDGVVFEGCCLFGNVFV